MPFLPSDFHAAAKLLSQNLPPAGESRYRTTAGRAYYAAWLATREAIRVLYGLGTEYDPGHEQLANSLAGDQVNADVREIGTLLNTLRLKRITADYKLHKHLLEDEADDSVGEAAELLTKLPGATPKLPKLPSIR